MRIKTKWHKKDRPKDVGEIAGVLAPITWRVAVRAVDHIGDEEFKFESGELRFQVLEEFLAFLVQVLDRMAYDRMEDEERSRLITAVALRLADTFEENQRDWVGPGDYRGTFIDKLNERVQDYADFSYGEDGPGYQFKRYLGDKVLAIMGGKDINRWVIDQVMDIEIPEALKTISKGFNDLMR